MQQTLIRCKYTFLPIAGLLSCLMLRAGRPSRQPREMWQAGTPRITACVDYDAASALVSQAMTIAGRMFAAIEVPIDWRRGPRACAASTIEIRVSTRTPASVPYGVLGSTQFLEQGARVWIFADRIHSFASCASSGAGLCAAAETSITAHVLAHELGHSLEGNGNHSDRGVMKACWDADDFLQMKRRLLLFTTVDMELIHAGISSRWRPRVAAGVPVEH